jgi:protein-disulfide isomerase
MSKSSRARTRERKQERQKERQRNQQYLIIGAIVVIVVAIVGFYVLANLPSDAPLPETLDRYAGIPQSVNNDGFPMLGDPSAPVEVVEHSSFSCTHCEEFHQSSFDELLERVRQGQIRFVYVPRDLGSVANAEGANRGAMCALEQGKFWEMHDILFFWHDRFVNGAFQGNRISSGAEALGLDMTAFNSCFNSDRTTDLLNLARTEEISGTPTFKVNGTEVEASIEAITAAIDSLLQTNITNPPSNISPTATIEPTVEATEAVDTEATEEVEDEAEVTAEAETTEESE